MFSQYSRKLFYQYNSEACQNFRQEKGQAARVDKKATSERPDKQVRAQINQISEHPDKKSSKQPEPRAPT